MEIRLTAEGRSYALRVIRVHRLWERFLATAPGYPNRNGIIKLTGKSIS
jgi:Mn-dependent DtxR family transcriptional regulator